MKDRLIKFLILAIIAAVLCAGFIYLDNVIVANAQAECLDDCIEDCLETEGCIIDVACAAYYNYYNPPLPETGPYPAPVDDPIPYPAPLPFSFPSWLQVILDSITAFWL